MKIADDFSERSAARRSFAMLAARSSRGHAAEHHGCRRDGHRTMPDTPQSIDSIEVPLS